MLRKIGLLACLLWMASAAMAAEAGRVVFATGQAQVGRHPAVVGDAVEEGDELNTGTDGYVYVKTIDSGFLILRPNSRARVVSYHIDNDNPANTRVKLELLAGVARSISGQSVKQARKNFRFNTPVAAIGVRGTDFVVYTDQQTSRVAVMSGGIVMSGFTGNCGPEGSGPCEGANSRELFAGQEGQLLQVQRGQALPQLLSSPALSPDHAAPARGDEPAGKPVAGPVADAAHGTEPNLDAQKGDLKFAKPPGSEATVVPPPVVVTEPPPTGPVTTPVTPVVPEVMWGRWRDIAGRAPDTKALAQLNSGKYAQGFTLGAYVIKRVVDTALVLPREGQASFKLDGGEATLTRTGGQQLAATMQDGRLDMDFAKRTFNTSMVVVSPTDKMTVTGFGDITLKGELSSDFLSNTTIRGYLGGKGANEAVYLFRTMNDMKLTAEGVARWSR